jgi:DNA-binding ferritin-like protein (Dps family)
MTGKELLNELLEMYKNDQLNNTEVLISTPAEIQYFAMEMITDNLEDKYGDNKQFIILQAR